MVSIILPNLNTDHRFLIERLASIINQTDKEWECIVIDGHSENGSWEILQDYASRDHRFIVSQRVRKGIYNAWNEGIKQAKGDFVYIAPSDDTMMPELLLRLRKSLERYPDCQLAHCNLRIINDRGLAVTNYDWSMFPAAKFFDDNIGRMHIRYAPHDGILHAFIRTVYTSMTQLLIRKSVFDDIGLFLEDHGSIADFEWAMRASMRYNVLHVPEYLAYWRIHDSQATQTSTELNPRTYKTLLKWLHSNLTYLKTSSHHEIGKEQLVALSRVYRQNAFSYSLPGFIARIPFADAVISKLTGFKLRPTTGLREARQYFAKNGLNTLVTCVENTNS
ncbi:glycosyltransferase [Chryseolinea sp. T2]|uniref:glycosyltransferase n=1 Tax=Chryseolinea sp. T2 TaxID=3129255 RepID=UPI003077312B